MDNVRSQILGPMFKIKLYSPKNYLLNFVQYALSLSSNLLHFCLVFYIFYLPKSSTNTSKQNNKINRRFMQSSTTAYKKLNILKINEFVNFVLRKFLHRRLYNKLPSNFRIMLLVLIKSTAKTPDE